jgi:hypothetical protein
VREERTGIRYLTIVGLLYPDNRLVLQPGFVTERPEYAGEDPESNIRIELLDEGGKALLRQRLAASPVCADGRRIDYWVIASKIPFREGARVARFLRDDIVLEEVRIPSEGPIVRLEWEPRGELRGDQEIRWAGEHPEGAPVNYILSYSSDDGESWRPVSPPTPGTEGVVNFDRLPGGERCRLGLTASDGFNTVTVTTDPFEVPVKPCMAMILAPEDGSEFAEGETAILQGQGFYLEENRPELEALEWRSSVDGPLGRGGLLELPNLSPGAHTITLVAGTGDRAGESTVEIRIGRP